MNPNSHNSMEEAGAGEDTLRLIAGLPAPEGLEERVHTALRSAPRKGRVLAWPFALRADARWVRATAAAAIVTIVAGGSWGVYSHIQPWQAAKAPAAPARVGSAQGFSGAGAKRSPQTLQPLVVSAPPKPAEPYRSHKKTHKTGAAQAVQTRMEAPNEK